MNKLLTLAVPTYNMERHIEKCVLSCMCENKDYLDIIIVNDGSTDHSSEIAHRLQDCYPDIVRTIDKENGNYGTCVNYALKEAKGKYFRMLDADDWADTSALNNLLNHLKDCNADCIVTTAEDYLRGKKLMQCLGRPEKVQDGRIYDARSFDGIAMGFDDLYCSHIITYKTQILRNINLQLQAGISYTDNEYVFYPLDHIDSIIFYDLPVYQYYVGREGATTAQTVTDEQARKVQSQMWQVLKPMFDYFYANYDKNNAAVRNNQRILLSIMITWIYLPIFRHKGLGDKCFVQTLEPYFRKDSILSQRVDVLMSQGLRNEPINWYLHYKNSGRIKTYRPLFDWAITNYYYKQKVENIKGSIRKMVMGFAPSIYEFIRKKEK